MRLFAGDKYDLRAVSMPHEPVVSRAVYERFFGARLLNLNLHPRALPCARQALAAQLKRPLSMRELSAENNLSIFLECKL